MTEANTDTSPDPIPTIEGREYQYDFILKNPIEARCERCKRREAIHAPSLENVRCFWCGPNREARLVPVDKAAYHNRMGTLWLYTVSEQLDLKI